MQNRQPQNLEVEQQPVALPAQRVDHGLHVLQGKHICRAIKVAHVPEQQQVHIDYMLWKLLAHPMYAVYIYRVFIGHLHHICSDTKTYNVCVYICIDVYIEYMYYCVRILIYVL